MNVEAAADAGNGGKKSFISEIFTPGSLLPSFTAGVVVAVLVLILSISFAALIFSGDISHFVPMGIGLMLITSVIAGIIIALTGSYPGTISTPQDKIAPILALMAGSIVTQMPQGASPDQVFLTVCAAIAISTLATGLFLGALGLFRLGAFIRFIPYPVIGGFLAGAGWLMVLGAIKTMTGVKVTFEHLPQFLSAGLLVKWGPGFVFAVAMLVVMRRFKHFLTMPAMLIGSILLFHIVLMAMGVSIADARSEGWMLQPLPGGGLWKPLNLRSIPGADWSVILNQGGGFATIILVSAISLLLNASAIELQSEHEMDLDHELRAAGGSNVVTSIFGGMVGFHSLSTSSLIIKMGVRSRLVAIVSSLICLAALFFGASSLSYVPVPIIGGLLMFLGFSFLIEWVYESWFKLPKSDFMVVVMILVTVGAVGYLQGVAVGLVAAVILFVVNYSRINVVKNALNGATFRSNVDRPKAHRAILREQGDKLLILRLQGFIFFGTANNLLNMVKERVGKSDIPALEYLVLDFRDVTGIDTSAVLSLTKMGQLADKRSFCIILTQLTDEVKKQLEKANLLDEEHRICKVFDDIDHGVEWCEDRILIAGDVRVEGQEVALKRMLEEFLSDRRDVSQVSQYLERMEMPAGTMLIRQGDPSDDLYIVESGEVTVLLELASGKSVRIRKISAGTIVGEMGLYLGAKRSASVVTEKASVIYKLSRQALEKMDHEDPGAAAAFHLFIARLLAERLNNTDKALRAILD